MTPDTCWQRDQQQCRVMLVRWSVRCSEDRGQVSLGRDWADGESAGSGRGASHERRERAATTMITRTHANTLSMRGTEARAQRPDGDSDRNSVKSEANCIRDGAVL